MSDELDLSAIEARMARLNNATTSNTTRGDAIEITLALAQDVQPLLDEISRLREIVNAQKMRPDQKSLVRQLRNRTHEAKGWKRKYHELQASMQSESAVSS